MLSISTCWNSHRHTDGEAMIHELLEMGFDAVELGHGIRVTLLPGVEKVVDRGEVVISSLHNFCPLPLEIFHAAPDCLEFTSHREAERRRAISQTRRTLQTAVRLGVRRIVLHGGRVAMKPVTRPLLDLAAEGGHLSAAYARMKLHGVQQREAVAPCYVARLAEALRELVDEAAQHGITLALEGRHSYEEVPSEREFPALLEAFPTVGYWHDFGHLQVKHNLGFVDHTAWLATMAPRLVGAHLHDVRWPGRDHQAPFTGGSVDYDRLIPLLPKDVLLVWEMSSRQSREDVVLSLERWRERFA